MTNVARTILTIMPHIDSYCDATTKANHVRAMNSFYGTQDTYKLKSYN